MDFIESFATGFATALGVFAGALVPAGIFWLVAVLAG